MSAELFVASAREFVARKVRWRHQGMKPWAVDCRGLVVLSITAAGYDIVNHGPAKYGREPWDDLLRKGLRAEFGEPVSDWSPGDIALIRWGKGAPSHLGIIADYLHGGLSIIHAERAHGVHETALSGRIRDCVVEVYRPKWGAP